MTRATTADLSTVLDRFASVVGDLATVDVRSLSTPELAAAVVRLASLVDRLTAGQARLVAEADRAGVWSASGSRDMAGWLADQTRASYGRSVELLALADTLERSPLLADKLASGHVSTATAVALHRTVVSPPAGAAAADVDALVEMCAGSGPRDARAAVEVWTSQHQTVSDDELEARRHARRSVRFSPAVDGLVTMTTVLPTLAANSVRKALCSLARLNANDRPLPDGADDDHRTTEQRLADALVQLASAATTGDLSGREAPTLLVTIDLDSLEGRDDRPATTEFGDTVPATTVRQLVDDATIRTIVHRGPTVVGIGRDRRLATRTQYAALVARDGRCRWPGCHIPASWCEVDHLVPWHAGGRTDLDNLVLWCSHHHHRKHAAGVTVLGDAHRLRLSLSDGSIIECPPNGHAVRHAPHGRTTDGRTIDAGPDSGRRRRTSAAA